MHLKPESDGNRTISEQREWIIGELREHGWGSPTLMVEDIISVLDRLQEDLWESGRRQKGLRLLAEGQKELLACYRIGKQPKESTFKKLDQADKILSQ